MAEKELSSSSNTIPSTARIEAVIRMLTVLIKIGKILPWIVLAFAGVNLALAILYLTRWNGIVGVIINLVFATAGFVFFGQLIKRRKIHRYNYQYRTTTTTDQHSRLVKVDEERNVDAELTKGR
jgi:thiol:disulfide interchange protein